MKFLAKTLLNNRILPQTQGLVPLPRNPGSTIVMMSKIKLIYIKTIVEITICNLREHSHVLGMEKQQLLHGQHDAIHVQQPGDRKRGRLEQVRSSL